MSHPALQYEPRIDARPVFIEQDGNVTRIVVPMRGPYAPVPRWFADLDLLTLIVVPVCWVSAMFVRACLRLPKPPRAEFIVSAERFQMTLRDHAGEKTTFDCPRAAVLEARASRYGRGLWLDVPGHIKENFLTDLPPESIHRLEQALADALAPTAAPATLNNR